VKLLAISQALRVEGEKVISVLLGLAPSEEFSFSEVSRMRAPKYGLKLRLLFFRSEDSNPGFYLLSTGRQLRLAFERCADLGGEPLFQLRAKLAYE
jgi:hypothetical protein